MKIARKVPAAILGAAVSQTRWLRGSMDMVSGSTSPKMMISFPVSLLRRKKAELSTVATTGSPGMRRGDRAGEKKLNGGQQNAFDLRVAT